MSLNMMYWNKRNTKSRRENLCYTFGHQERWNESWFKCTRNITKLIKCYSCILQDFIKKRKNIVRVQTSCWFRNHSTCLLMFNELRMSSHSNQFCSLKNCNRGIIARRFKSEKYFSILHRKFRYISISFCWVSIFLSCRRSFRERKILNCSGYPCDLIYSTIRPI